MPAMLAAAGLDCVRQGRTLFRSLSFDVEAGERAAPAGPRKLLEHAIELAANIGKRRPLGGGTFSSLFLGFDWHFLSSFSHDASSSSG